MTNRVTGHQVTSKLSVTINGVTEKKWLVAIVCISLNLNRDKRLPWHKQVHNLLLDIVNCTYSSIQLYYQSIFLLFPNMLLLYHISGVCKEVIDTSIMALTGSARSA